MGRRREQLEILLAKKDEQIQILESRIQAYTTRVSQLQTRLLSTLDALDQVKSLQEQELVPIERENARLKAQLNRYLAVVKAAEAERDDMQDAVLKLIEKVEASSDYSKWPRSQIQLSSLSASLSHPLPKPPPISEDQIISYASSILASLRLERDNERKAHARTRDLVEKRILTLEAQLSRREVELERCIVGGHVHAYDGPVEGDRTPRQRGSPLGMAAAPVDMDVMEQIGNEEIISILDSTVARNKILEGEVRTLVRRLEEARASTSQPSTNIPNSAARVPSNHRSDQRSREPAQSANTHPAHGSEDPRESRFLDHSLVDHQLLRDLDHQIRELGRKVDLFAEERRSIQQTLPSMSSPSVQNSNLPDYDQRIRDLESECERLRRSEDNLRDELDLVRADAHAREDDLLERIRELEDVRSGSREDGQRTANVQPPSQIEPEPPDLLDPFASDDGELSMELATPLMPTSIIDINVDVDNGIRSDFVNDNHQPGPSQPRSVPPPPPAVYEDHEAREYRYYDEAPSIPLPPSPPPPEFNDHADNHHHQDIDDGDAYHLNEDQFEGEDEEDDPGGDSPTLSQIELETCILEGEMLTRELTPPPPPSHEGVVGAEQLLGDHGVVAQHQLDDARQALEDGMGALERLEGLVRELGSP